MKKHKGSIPHNHPSWDEEEEFAARMKITFLRFSFCFSHSAETGSLTNNEQLLIAAKKQNSQVYNLIWSWSQLNFVTFNYKIKFSLWK